MERRIRLIVVDINLYWWYHLRVAAKDPLYMHIGQRSLILLGLWYPFKQLALCIWRMYAPCVLTPLHKHMFPSARLPTKPKLSQLMPFYGLLLWSFRTNRAFQELLRLNTETSFISDCFLYFIPMVCKS